MLLIVVASGYSFLNIAVRMKGKRLSSFALNLFEKALAVFIETIIFLRQIR